MLTSYSVRRLFMPVIRQFLIFVLIVFVMVGCGGDAPETEERVPGEGEAPTMVTPGTYPEPQQSETYPGPQSESYPAPEALSPEFTIDRPVTEANTQVTGTGPAGAQIELINLTRDNDFIGQTTINNDGTFVIDTDGKLIAKNEIALILANTADTDTTSEGLDDNPAYQQIAAGIVVATAIVQESNQ